MEILYFVGMAAALFLFVACVFCPIVLSDECDSVEAGAQDASAADQRPTTPRPSA